MDEGGTEHGSCIDCVVEFWCEERREGNPQKMLVLWLSSTGVVNQVGGWLAADGWEVMLEWTSEQRNLRNEIVWWFENTLINSVNMYDHHPPLSRDNCSNPPYPDPSTCADKWQIDCFPPIYPNENTTNSQKRQDPFLLFQFRKPLKHIHHRFTRQQTSPRKSVRQSHNLSASRYVQ